jgi:hypothetical protein
VVDFLTAEPGEFFLLGDSSILYGLTGRRSVSPVLWFHPHLTVPWDRGRVSERFEEDLTRRLDEQNVRFVIVENGGTQMGVRPDRMPHTAAWVSHRLVKQERIGCFEVFEISNGSRRRYSPARRAEAAPKVSAMIPAGT